MMRTEGVNIRVTNNSYCGIGFYQSLYDAIAQNGDAGMLFVAAAGNFGWSNDALKVCPATYNLKNIIAVAATDQNDAMAWWSDYGSTVALARARREHAEHVPRRPIRLHERHEHGDAACHGRGGLGLVRRPRRHGRADSGRNFRGRRSSCRR